MAFRFATLAPAVPSICATIDVPAAVPSLFHNCQPLTPSFAEKYTVPPIIARYCGRSPPPVTLTLVTIDVPADVPSLFHSWDPCAPSFAEKSTVPAPDDTRF